ncbi:M48 family metallopeptidase [Roseiarcaceae bacterium H3SJ34-1]|uniref:M48 family metallopeptidase n=1 Tax=Terripilifer ovatus TaxID=3032367 RepID=UPI003AB99412|nr:M48 family metallopeptidase [Roseiarcaceae bacterium H3SJ34-1]
MIEGSALYYDGLSNKQHAVTLRIGATLEIVEDGLMIAGWPFEWIRRADSSDGRIRLRTTNGSDLARLVLIDETFARSVLEACPRLEHNDPSGTTSTGRIVFWSLAAATSLILIGLYGIPFIAERLTPLIPASFERRLGEMADSQVTTVFDATPCQNPDGVRAFGKLIGDLQKTTGLSVPITATVVRSGVPNAIALPGGKVYLFRGLLEKAESADEIAGVLAHELGHVKHRDSVRILLQAGGTSFLLGLLLGDVTGSGAAIFAARTLLDASHSRGAEAAADDVAIESMNKLGRSPQPMGELLLRITGKEDRGLLNFIASHPLSEARLQRMSASPPAVPGPPLLDAGEWAALKQICGPSGQNTKTQNPKT